MKISERVFFLILIASFLVSPLLTRLVYGIDIFFFKSTYISCMLLIIAVFLLLLYKRRSYFMELKVDWKVIIASFVVIYIIRYQLDRILPPIDKIFHSSLFFLFPWSFIATIVLGSIGIVYFMLKKNGAGVGIRQLIMLVFVVLIVPFVVMSVISLVSVLMNPNSIDVIFDNYGIIRMNFFPEMFQIFALVFLFETFKSSIKYRSLALAVLLIGVIRFLMLLLIDAISAEPTMLYSASSFLLKLAYTMLGLMSVCFVTYLIGRLLRRKATQNISTIS